MDDKALEKKLTDKKFLKSNDLVTAATVVVNWCAKNRGLTMAFALVLVLLGLTIPGFNYYRQKQVLDFNAKLYQASKSLKKEQLYRELVAEYQSLPAAQLARIQLINNLLEHDDEAGAIKEIEAGLNSEARDIFQTVLILKRANIFKKNEQFLEASKFIADHEKQVIVTFINRMRMIRADLLLLSGERKGARELYQELASFEGAGAQGLTTDFDPALANEAKDQLLLIDLGVI